ncbi:MAG TPA: ABC transporter ATP-binding protein [Baekduia sp.]|uniref:ABC transporter ATP-binding protein n=1 Tax=Baekduia sp. TaxID=2600305 RepID=UPI002C9840BA|nr:ABC transporter ATP-binding protein [Baekduia sp.]HMJ36009.1 ABC transporter ATP-binding protein [Baekduia sp.]
MTPHPRPTPDGAVLRARGLVKVHGSGRGQRRILDRVDLDVRPGELLAIVGRSGSGKSTLLQLLGGLDRADAGTVEVGGRWVAGPRDGRPSERELSALRREEIGFVFQFFHLLPELDGEANVLLPATLPGADGRAAAARGRALIDQLGLRDVAALRPHQLSGGEQQRFALARALVGDPSLVLADEPIGNLDVAAGDVVLDLLRGIADGGRAVVMVTHQAEATARADRVLRLEGGALVVDRTSARGDDGQVRATG